VSSSGNNDLKRYLSILSEKIQQQQQNQPRSFMFYRAWWSKHSNKALSTPTTSLSTSLSPGGSGEGGELVDFYSQDTTTVNALSVLSGFMSAPIAQSILNFLLKPAPPPPPSSQQQQPQHDGSQLSLSPQQIQLIVNDPRGKLFSCP
jgi:hypothetical protein